MRKLIFMILVFTAVGASAQVKPYGFAGEDKYVYFDPGGSYPKTKVGEERQASSGPDDGPCPQYFWCCTSKPSDEAFCFIMDAHEPITELMLSKPGQYILELTRVSEYGIQRESVTVVVTNDIQLISATPKKNCYKNGTTMKVSDFKFVTSPQLSEDKYEDKIRLLPRTETLNVGNKLEDMFYYQEVFFEVGNDDNEGNQIWKKDPVPAKVMATSGFKFNVRFDDDGWWTLFDCGLFSEEAVEKVKITKSLLELAGRIGKLPKYMRSQLPEFMSNPKAKPGQIAPEPPYTISIKGSLDGIGAYLVDECCNDLKTVRIGITGDGSLGADVSVVLPIPGLSAPGVGGLSILGGVGFETQVGLDISVPIGCVETGFDTKLSFLTTTNFSLAVSANIISPSVASINLGVNGEASVKTTWDLVNSFSPPELDANLHAVIYAIGVGIKVFEIDIPVLPPGEPEISLFVLPEDLDDFDPNDNGGDDGDGGDGGDGGE